MSSKTTNAVLYRWWRAVRLAAVGLLLLALYVFSYAPVVRVYAENRDAHLRDHPFDGTTIWFGDYGVSQPIDGSVLPIYSPVDWTIDNTFLRKPLIVWARLWKVDCEFILSEVVRSLDPDEFCITKPHEVSDFACKTGQNSVGE